MPMKQQIQKMRGYLGIFFIVKNAQVLLRGKSATRVGWLSRWEM